MKRSHAGPDWLKLLISYLYGCGEEVSLPPLPPAPVILIASRALAHRRRRSNMVADAKDQSFQSRLNLGLCNKQKILSSTGPSVLCVQHQTQHVFILVKFGCKRIQNRQTRAQWDILAERCSYSLPTAAAGLLLTLYSHLFGEFEMVGEATC